MAASEKFISDLDSKHFPLLLIINSAFCIEKIVTDA